MLKLTGMIKGLLGALLGVLWGIMLGVPLENPLAGVFLMRVLFFYKLSFGGSDELFCAGFVEWSVVCFN